ncbi:MAG: class I SAM-dependent methyltransferase family protein [Promethearchaeota archaeon]
MGFKEKLKEILKESLSEEELSLLPRGFQSIGKVMIVKLNPKILKKKELVGKACLEINPYMKSVYINMGKIKGKFREPENIELIAGEDDPIVEHKEHSVIYRFDLTKIMFSKGNINERKLLATLVKDGEVIVDMFAGIGYFSLPIAKNSNPKKIYSIELNPISHQFLVENIKLNHLEDVIIPILGDCKQEVLNLSKQGIRADRVIMGIFPAPKAFIKEALTLTKDDGTIFHYEGVVEKERYIDLYAEFNHIAEENKYICKLISYRFVKSYGPNLYHVVLDIRVSEKN